MKLTIRLLIGPLLLLSTFYSTRSSGQGRLLIAGGGNEKNGSLSWSTAAYSWAASGRKVAIISTNGTSYPAYFKNYCGAANARDFVVGSRQAANDQALHDTLLTYHTIFFAGGDQWDYYNYYEGTLLASAVETVYEAGGTIGGTSAGMHILSGTVFTAQNGTVYPDECIINPQNQYIKLADGFWDFAPGYVFDTHVAERGRFARLVAFVANKALTNSQKVIGLGLDDMTCITVDENQVATVYGTGVATLVEADPPQFGQNNSRMLADSVRVSQLLHGCSFNLLTGTRLTDEFTKNIQPVVESESIACTLFASGSNSVANNQAMLEAVENAPEAEAAVIIVTSPGNQLAPQLVPSFANAQVLETSTANGSDPTWNSLITATRKFVFCGNDPAPLTSFLTTPNGLLLRDQIGGIGHVVAFVGSDSRLAGAVVVENYNTLYASYYGEMTFTTGLGLLKNSVFMPETFANADYYENTATALPFAIVNNRLKYGFWLTGNNFVHFYPDGSSLLVTSGGGNAPVMMLVNNGLKGDVSTHSATGSTATVPRQVAGFDRMLFHSFDPSVTYLLGTDVGIGPAFEETLSFRIRRSNHHLLIESPEPMHLVELTDITGRKVKSCRAIGFNCSVAIGDLPGGFYIVNVNGRYSQKIAL